MGCASTRSPVRPRDLATSRYATATVHELAAAPAPSAPSPGTLRAGAARVEITPPLGTPLAGFAARGGRGATSVRDPLYARALLLDDGRDRVALIGADLLAVNDALTSAVFERVREPLGLVREQLLLCATHTHAGTGALSRRFLERFTVGPFDAKIFQMTADRLAEALLQAGQQLAPASLGSGHALVTTVSQNRMVRGGPIDPDLAVLRVNRENGTPLALLVNFAIHSTVLGHHQRDISGDLAGAVAHHLERAYPGSVTIFTVGALGDQTPVSTPAPSRHDRLTGLGRTLGERAHQAAERITTRPTVDLVALGVPVTLPPPRVRLPGVPVMLPTWLGRRFVDSQTYVSVIEVGPTLLIALPAELTVAAGTRLKQLVAVAGYDPVLIGLAHDYIGYVYEDRTTPSRAYERRQSFYGPALEPYLLMVVRHAVGKLLGPRLDPATLAQKAAWADMAIASSHLTDEGLLAYRTTLPPPAGGPQATRLADAAYFTACYLAAEAFRFGATGEADAVAQCRRALQGLELLERVTGQPGLLARSCWRAAPDTPLQKHVSRGAPPFEQYLWKGDVSVDQLIAVVFAYGIAADTLTDEDLRDRVRAATDRLVRRLVRDRFTIRDHDGRATTWGNLAPETLEEHLNALLALALLKTAAHLTRDPLFQDAYEELIHRHGYLKRTAQLGQEWRAAGDTQNYSDLCLAWLALYPLLRWERNADARTTYERVADDLWDVTQTHGNALASFLYAAVGGLPGDPDPLAVRTLAFFPVEKRVVETRYAGRQDLGLLTLDRHGTLQGHIPLPIEARPTNAFEWKANPFRVEDHAGVRGELAVTAVDYLLAYWCGRYHGLLGSGSPVPPTAPQAPPGDPS